jgi:hypothetical protein
MVQVVNDLVLLIFMPVCQIDASSNRLLFSGWACSTLGVTAQEYVFDCISMDTGGMIGGDQERIQSAISEFTR